MMEKRPRERDIAHLLRRAGFGPGARELAEYAALGFEGAVDRLIEGARTPPPKDPTGFNPFLPGAITATWLERMRSTDAPLAEKLALFWHGHFATSLRKVEDARLMWQQLSTFRALGAGRFEPLVLAVSRDPAMIRWLDGNSNRKGAPNENYARELMELFTLGRGNYTEQDVREAARAFTGWCAEGGRFVYRAEYHDSGPKSLLGRTGNLAGEDVVRTVTSSPVCARFIASRLLIFFSHPEPTDAEVGAAAAVFTRTDGDIASVMRHIFLAPAFRSEAAYRGLVKSPAELVVGSIRLLDLPAVPSWAAGAMADMGQTLFAPPTVKGWDGGRAWLAAGALLARIRFVSRIAAEAGRATERAVHFAFDGSIPPHVDAALAGAGGAERLALALASPEYQLN